MLTMVNVSLPENERQVRPLRGLSAEKATEAWKRAAELAGEHKITGEIVKTAVAEVCPPKSTNLHPKLNWQLTVEPLLKEALRFAKSGDRDKVEQLVQRALLLLGVDRDRNFRREISF